jgi:hypothetical protein
MGVNDVAKNITWQGHDGFLIKAGGKGAIVGSAADARRFSEAVRGTCEVVVLG